jgi:hypothetical protein
MTEIKELIVSKQYKQGGLVYLDVTSISAEEDFRALFGTLIGRGRVSHSLVLERRILESIVGRVQSNKRNM